MNYYSSLFGMLTLNKYLLVGACLKGTKRNADDTGCVTCPRGSYSDKDYETSCTNCAPGKWTKMDKATSIAQCEGTENIILVFTDPYHSVQVQTILFWFSLIHITE